MSYAFTRVPNTFIDEHLAQLSGSEAKLLLVLTRQTIGFQRDAVSLSFNQLLRFTGIRSRATLNQAIESLIKQKLITTSKTHGQTNTYQINHDKTQPVQKLNTPSTETELPRSSSLYRGTENEPVPVQKLNRGGSENELPPVQKLNSPKRNEKEMVKESEKEKHQSNHQSESILRGVSEHHGDGDPDALKVLIDFGLWESAARKLINEKGLSAKVISSAISAICEEKRQGASIRNPAALLRRRLENDWKPKSVVRRLDFSVDQEFTPAIQKPLDPDFLMDRFTDSSGRQWIVREFIEMLMSQLKLQLPRDSFYSWIQPAKVNGISIDDGRLSGITIQLASDIAYEWVTGRLFKVIERTTETMLGYPVNWTYTTAASASAAA